MAQARHATQAPPVTQCNTDERHVTAGSPATFSQKQLHANAGGAKFIAAVDLLSASSASCCPCRQRHGVAAAMSNLGLPSQVTVKKPVAVGEASDGSGSEPASRVCMFREVDGSASTVHGPTGQLQVVVQAHQSD